MFTFSLLSVAAKPNSVEDCLHVCILCVDAHVAVSKTCSMVFGCKMLLSSSSHHSATMRDKMSDESSYAFLHHTQETTSRPHAHNICGPMHYKHVVNHRVASSSESLNALYF